jgi:hypothetical protein
MCGAAMVFGEPLWLKLRPSLRLSFASHNAIGAPRPSGIRTAVRGFGPD